MEIVENLSTGLWKTLVIAISVPFRVFYQQPLHNLLIDKVIETNERVVHHTIQSVQFDYLRGVIYICVYRMVYHMFV